MERSPFVKRAVSFTSTNGLPLAGPFSTTSAKSHCSTDALISAMRGSLPITSATAGARLRRRRPGELRLPLGVFFGDQVLRPIAVPLVPVAALVADLGQVILLHAVAVGEDRAV